jgi:spore photoproduct lyase
VIPIPARALLIVEGVEDDPLMRDRAERLRPAVLTDDVRRVDDAELAGILDAELPGTPRHGMEADFAPIVIFNRFTLDDADDERRRRAEAFPTLGRHKFDGYGGFDWRDSGSPAYRESTGLVCQPAWQLHTIVGCHFRCAYCHLGRFQNVMMNMEDFVGRLDGWLEKCPDQTLFQYDNYTDTVCFEPEYGGAGLLIDYFARRPGRALELYVGKSDNVDFLLDYDHRGHTVCCWSISGPTQSVRFEQGSAPMERRIEAVRKCQQAGYPVRVRFSPIIPVRGWRRENREMIERVFAAADPDVITIETIRFLDSEQIERLFDVSLLDEEFAAAMSAAQGRPHAQGCEVPDEWRVRVYRFFFDELNRVSPETPVAFCREKRTLWEHFEGEFARRRQHPDDYVCNCGPYSAPETVGAWSRGGGA